LQFTKKYLSTALSAGILGSTLLLNPMSVSSAIAANTSTYNYNLSGGSLSSVLVQFGVKSKKMLTFDPELVKGLSSNGLKGEYLFNEGLEKLLQGSDLTYKQIDKNTYRIIKNTASANLDIKDQEKLVITATRTEQEVTSAPASVSIITREDLRKKPVADFTDILRESVGINVNQSQSTGRRDIQVRGMDSQYTLLLINGRKTTSSEALIRGNDFDLSTFPVDSIERIEVIRGPMSALYGSDALGGVINIITREAEEEWQTSLTLSAEAPFDGKGGDTFKQSLFTSGKLNDDLRMTLSVENSTRDGWKDQNNDPSNGYFLLEEHDQINTRLGLVYALDSEQELSFDLAYSDDSRFTNYLSWGPSYTDQDSQRLSTDIGYRAEFGDWAFQVTGGREEIDLSDETDRYAEKISEQVNYTLNASATFEGEVSSTTFGADLVKTEISSDTDWVGSADVLQSALYLQTQYDLNDQLTLTLGGRQDHHEYFGHEFSPRAYLVYQINDSFTLKGGYSEAFNAPDLFQLSDNYRVLSCGGTCFLTGNSDLKPETSENYEVSLLVDQANWNASITYFDNTVSNLIERDIINRINVGLSLPVIYYQNVDKASFKGWELTANTAITDHIDLSFNASVIDAVNESTGEELFSRPDKNINLGLNWSPNSQQGYFLNVRHIGSMTNDSWPAPTEVESYEVVDIGGHYKFGKDWTLRAGINNVLDKRLDLEDENYEQVQLGRSLYLSSQWTF